MCHWDTCKLLWGLNNTVEEELVIQDVQIFLVDHLPSPKNCLDYMTYFVCNNDSRNILLSYDLYFSCLFRTHHHEQKHHNQLVCQKTDLMTNQFLHLCIQFPTIIHPLERQTFSSHSDQKDASCPKFENDACTHCFWCFVLLQRGTEL